MRGYHGTTAASATLILSEGFRISDNDYDWLGTGAYFFEEAPIRAWQWAQSHHGSEAAVLQAEIDLRDCMDLCDTDWAALLNDTHDRLVSRARTEAVALPRQSQGAHRLDKLVIDYAVSALEEQDIKIASVRGLYQEGSPVFPGSWIFDLNHIQIAVRDASAITHVAQMEPWA